MSTVPGIDQAATKLGWRSLLALGEEAGGAWAAPVLPTRSFEFRSESLQQQRARIESEAVRRSEFSPRWGEGAVGVGGSVTMEHATKGFGLIWLHALGDVATTEVVPGEVYSHLFTPGDLQGRSLTAQVIRDDVAFDYTGLKVASLQLSCAVDQIATIVPAFIGRAELLGQAEHVEAFPDGFDLLTFIHGNLTIGGEPVAVNSVQSTLENSLDDARRRLGTPYRRHPQRTGFRDLTATLNADFADLSLYNRFVSGEHAELDLRFVAGEIGATGEDYELRLRTTVRFDGPTPTVEGPTEIRQEVNVKAFPSDAIPDTVEVTYVTDDATP